MKRLNFMIMTLLMCAELVFAKTDQREQLIITQPNSVTIESSWKNLTDKATIELPKNVKDFDKEKIKTTFRRGDAVTINLGYNGDLLHEFSGYITTVSTDIPIVITLEDEMWKLKQTMVNVSQKQTNLKKLLEAIVPEGFTVDALDANIGTVRYPNWTLAKVLDDIKTNYGFYSYMKGKTLVCGKIYEDDTDLAAIPLHMENDVISNDMKYRQADDIAISITVKSTLKNGDKIEVTVGDEGGEVREIVKYDIASKEDLKVIGDENYKLYKRDGFTGSLTTFGTPSLQHGNKVELFSREYNERNGTYYVDTVKKTFDDSPMYHQTVELGLKA
jgi:hypothetical protein